MIRTRDFLLYVIVLMFLVMGVVYTGMFRAPAVSTTEPTVVLNTPGLELSAAPSNVDETRAERLERLQAQIAAGEGEIVTAPPVFTSVDQVAAEEALAAATSAPEVGTRSVQYCGAAVPHVATLAWPAISEIRIIEGAYVLSTLTTETITVGSSTEVQETITPVLDLPIRSIRTNFDSCLPDTLIGVTTVGQPLMNQSAALYHNTSASTPIGYTRDGFTIYGPLPDPSVLDSCGGYYGPSGAYQYHVRINEPFMLGCYAGIPVNVAI